MTRSNPEFYVDFSDKISGPFTFDQLQKLARKGRVTPESQISRNRSDWIAAADLNLLTFGTGEGDNSTSIITYCSKCSDVVEADAEECKSCGHAFYSEDPQVTKKRIRQYQNCWLGVLVASLYLGLAVVLYNVGVRALPLWAKRTFLIVIILLAAFIVKAMSDARFGKS